MNPLAKSIERKHTTSGINVVTKYKAAFEELAERTDSMRQLLLDYRNTPNCGEYGVTKGWRERVDALVGKGNE